MSKYDLVGVNGNSFSIMAYVIRAMKECGFSKQEINTYQDNAMGFDYNNLLNISIDMVEKCNDRVVADYKDDEDDEDDYEDYEDDEDDEDDYEDDYEDYEDYYEDDE